MQRIRQAYEFAREVHKEQLRKDGVTLYITHPLGTALILLFEFGLDITEAIVKAILHDVIEDAAQEKVAQVINDIREKFGDEVLYEVLELSRQRRTGNVEIDIAIDRAYLRNLLLDSYAVQMVKVADRLHNFRAFLPLTEESRPFFIGKMRNFIWFLNESKVIPLDVKINVLREMSYHPALSELCESYFRSILPLLPERIPERTPPPQQKDEGIELRGMGGDITITNITYDEAGDVEITGLEEMFIPQPLRFSDVWQELPAPEELVFGSGASEPEIPTLNLLPSPIQPEEDEGLYYRRARRDELPLAAVVESNNNAAVDRVSEAIHGSPSPEAVSNIQQGPPLVNLSGFI
jgi:hypothetical protein